LPRLGPRTGTRRGGPLFEDTPMAGMSFDLGVKEAVEALQGAFAQFGERAFPGRSSSP
jgi:hypothetical protein